MRKARYSNFLAPFLLALFFLGTSPFVFSTSVLNADIHSEPSSEWDPVGSEELARGSYRQSHVRQNPRSSIATVSFQSPTLSWDYNPRVEVDCGRQNWTHFSQISLPIQC